MKKFVKFCKECIGELKKVVWPSREQVFSSIKVVLISTIIVAVILGLFDFGFSEGFSKAVGA